MRKIRIRGLRLSRTEMPDATNTAQVRVPSTGGRSSRPGMNRSGPWGACSPPTTCCQKNPTEHVGRLEQFIPTSANITASRLPDADHHVQKPTPYGRSPLCGDHVAPLRHATWRRPCQPKLLFRAPTLLPVRNTHQPPEPTPERRCCHLH